MTSDENGTRSGAPDEAPRSAHPRGGDPAAGEATAALSLDEVTGAQRGASSDPEGSDVRGRHALDDEARRSAMQRSGAGEATGASPYGGSEQAPAATAATTGAGAAAGARTGSAEAHTTVLPHTPRPERPARSERSAPPRPASRPGQRPVGRSRRARLVLQRVDPWSVFLFSLVASICLGVVLLVAVATLYFVLANLGVLGSINNVLGEVLGGAGPDDVAQPFFTPGRVLGATAVLAAVDVVLLTVLATLSALLYNLCASLTGGVEVTLGERD